MPANSESTPDTRLDDDRAIGLRLLTLASGQLLQAEIYLGREGEQLHAGIHEARKCIRRTRAAIALGHKAFDKRAKALDEELRRLCRGMSRLRDGQALVEVLHRLAPRAPPALQAVLPDAEKTARLRRDQILGKALARDPGFASRRRRLQAARSRMQELDWQEITDSELGKAMQRSVKRAKKATKHAKRHPDNDHAWHVYRRRLRRLRQQRTLLSELPLPLPAVAGPAEDKAAALGESQDDVLLLGHCRRRSPFPPAQRALLRRAARERLSRTRTE